MSTLPSSHSSLVSPDLDRSITTNFYEQVEFIFAGAAPSQVGVAPGTIEKYRASLVRGTIVSGDDVPIVGAVVSVEGHPEYGTTLTQADGTFDLVVNGGSRLTLTFASPNTITAQRQWVPPWNESTVLEPVKLLDRDVEVTPVDFANASDLQVHLASEVTDQRGTRQMALLFKPGTVATLAWADGRTEVAPSLDVHATEFTVGPTGPQAMPANIADGTIYTYAIEFGALQAEEAGAEHVYFDPPAISYLDNFMDVPVGGVIPSGSYNRTRTSWVGEPNGRVVRILAIDAGMAVLDIAGEGLPATAEQLADLGVTTDELEFLAENYPVDKSLWRTPIPHFTDPVDLNFPGGFPPDAEPPLDLALLLASQGRCLREGSIIECEDQVLGQVIDVAGTPFSLHYRSSRMPGSPSFGLDIEYTDDDPPASLREARVDVTVGGKTLTQRFSSITPRARTHVRWDGSDAYGRRVQGAQPAEVCITYDYEAQPRTLRPEDAGEFGAFGDWTNAGLQVPSDGNTLQSKRCYARDGLSAGGIIPGVINKQNMVQVGSLLATDTSDALGGWTLDVHHTLNAQSGILYLGDGRQRSVTSKQPVVVRVAGNGTTFGLDTEVIPAIGVPINDPQAIAVAGDHSFYVAQSGRVRKVLPDGSWTTVAGTGRPGRGTSGGPATQTAIGTSIAGLAVTSDGTLFIADLSNRLLWMLRDGLLHVVAGHGGPANAPIDGGFVGFDAGDTPQGSAPRPRDINLACVSSITLAEDEKSLWITQSCGNSNQRVRLLQLGDLNDPADIGTARHMAGWPYPQWLAEDAEDIRPVYYVGEPNLPTDIWGWSGSNHGDDLPGPASKSWGPQWAIWRQPHAIALRGRDVFVAEGSGSTSGLERRIRKMSEFSVVTLGDKLTLTKLPNDRWPCNSLGCAWERVDDDDVTNVITTIAMSPNGVLHYATTGTDTSTRGVFVARGDRMPGARLLGGGTRRLDGDDVMAPALDFDLTRPNDMEFGPDGSLYVVDTNGDKVVRLVYASLGTYESSTVASEDGREYYEFDGQGRHLTTRDALTHDMIWAFSYADGRLVEVRDAQDRITRIHRDGSGIATAIESHDGRTTSLGYENGYLSSIRTPAGHSHVFGYRSDGLMSSMTTPAQRNHSFDYDDRGRLIRDTDAAGRDQTLEVTTHRPDLRVVEHRTELGRATTYRVQRHQSDRDVEHTQTWPDGTTTSTRTHADGREVLTTADGTRLTVTRAPHPQLGGTASFVREARMELPDGGPVLTATRSIVVDSGCSLFAEGCTLQQQGSDFYADRITESTTIQGNTSRRYVRQFTRAHSSGGQNVSATIVHASPSGRATRYTLGERGRVERGEQGTWNGTAFTPTVGLDAVTYRYSATGALEALDLGTGADAASIGFDLAASADGHVLSLMSGGKLYQATYDTDGMLASASTPHGDQSFQRDGDGFYTGYRAEVGGWHGFTSPEDGAEQRYSPAEQSTLENDIRFVLDGEGNVERVVRPDGKTIDVAYDGGGRLDHLTTPEGVIDASFTPAGKLDVITDRSGGMLDRNYSFGLPASELRRGPETGGSDHRVAWTWSSDMLLQTETVDDAHAVSYGYDLDGRPTSAGGLIIVPHVAIDGVDTTELGQVRSNVDYDRKGRPDLISYTNTATELYAASIGYGSNGRIDVVEEIVAGTSTTYAYGYDDAGRLVHVRVDGELQLTHEYGSNLDWERVTRQGETIVPTYDGHGRLASYGNRSFTYDSSGNRITQSGASTVNYIYDEFGLLRHVVTGTGDIEYILDGRNRRVGKRTDGVLQRAWLYRGTYAPVAELDASGAVSSRFVYATQEHVPDYMVRAGQTYRLVTDLRGSVRLVVAVSNGAIVQRLDYDPWGRVINDTNPGFQPFGFAGGLYDPDTGLVHFGARDYDPTTGRFLQPDPQLFAGGYGNLHAYCAFDPINLVDPTGEVSDWAMDAFTWADQKGVMNFLTGAAESASFGLGSTIRDAFFEDLNDVVDSCSWAYVAGELAASAVMGRTMFKLAGKTPCGLCFSGDTTVLTPDGRRPIETLRSGDLVWARNEVTGEESWQPVRQVFATENRAVLELTLERLDGSHHTLRVTEEHPLWSADDNDWDRAANLVIGESLDTAEGPARLVGAVVLPDLETVYNLEVDEAHTFFVGDLGLWAHNCKKFPVHHIATDKNRISDKNGGPWTPIFEEIFDGAGMKLSDPDNLVELAGHRGPHPEAYHVQVYDRLTDALEGLQRGSAQYEAALRGELRNLARDISRDGSYLNRLLTGRF